MMPSQFNARTVKAALQHRAQALRQNLSAAQETMQQTRAALEQAKADQQAAEHEITAFEKDFGVSLEELLTGYRPSLLRSEIEAAIEEFRSSGAELTLSDIKAVLMARGCLSAEEFNSRQVRNRLDVLLKHGTLRRCSNKRGVYAVVQRRTNKAKRDRKK